ncbi:MAG: phosphoribosylanthranilate isomerase [Proteobacteria bacterium]|nr:phosphoribosylanthranilate isomerase [Pseudomonadota bacterium]
MTIQVKICGINSVESADAAVRAGADFAGLMFHPGSPRALNAEQARMLSARMKGRTRLVAVMADPDDAALKTIIGHATPDFIQLHGKESVARVSEIRSMTGLPVIKVLAVADGSDLAFASSYEAVTDMLMFDAKAPSGAAREGGHGAAFDWQILKGRTFARPWLLAGGLNADNVARAISISGAPGVDVSSGVETAPGQKSPEMIRAFVDGVRNAEFASAQT